MAVKQTKKVSAATPVTTVNSTDKILVADTNGKLIPISLANLKAALNGGVDQNVQMDGVFIMYHLKNDDYPLMVKPHKWTALQSSGEIADGVVIVEGDKILVVAPTQTAVTWSSAAVSGGGTTTTDRVTAMNDWNGKANTKHLKVIGLNKKIELAAGEYIPSLGEMYLIYLNRKALNQALELIGSNPIKDDWYWTSTEYSATLAWRLNLSDGICYAGTKASGAGRVRPVSAFII